MTKLIKLLSEIGENAQPLEWSVEDLQDDKIDFWIESESPNIQGYDVTAELDEDLNVWLIAFNAYKDGRELGYYEEKMTGEFLRIMKTLQDIIEWLGDSSAWKEVGRINPIKKLSFVPADSQRARIYDYLMKKMNFSNWEKSRVDSNWLLTLK